MTIIRFPTGEKRTSEASTQKSAQSEQPSTINRAPSPLGIRVVWVILVVLWPILRKVLALDCLVQFLIATYHWDDAPFRGCLTFGIHFAVLTALTYFVATYKPRGL